MRVLAPEEPTETEAAPSRRALHDLPPKLLTVLTRALRLAEEGVFLGTRAWDPHSEARAVDTLVSVGLITPLDDESLPRWGRYRLAPGLPEPGDGPATFAAGVCLALHFWAWFASLQETSVLRSTVLVCLTPLWVGVAESVSRGALPSPRWLGGVLTDRGEGLQGRPNRRISDTNSGEGEGERDTDLWRPRKLRAVGGLGKGRRAKLVRQRPSSGA